MKVTTEDLSQALLGAAHKAGADAADAMVFEGISSAIGVRGGGLEEAERSEGMEVGLRVFVGQRQVMVSSSDTRPETLAALAERAVAMAAEAPDDKFAGLADPEQLTRDWDLRALELADPTTEPSPDDLMQDALAAEAVAVEVAGVSQVEAASGAYSRTQINLAASNGFSGWYARTVRSISCVAIAGTGTGMERDYDSDGRVYQHDLRSAQDIGKLAGERAVERLNARKPATGTYPVLFDERVSSSLIGHLVGAINGASVARGASWLLDAIGKPVLPDHLSLIEDPHRPRVSGSRPFDAEGLPTRRREIVENGILTGWMLDLASARQLQTAPTGNATRGLSSPPSPSAWNLALTQGDQSRDELLRDMNTGLLVTSMIGSTINPNTGDYSRGASGFWIENGEIAYPVNECTVAGNLRDMMRRIVPANDARSHLSRVVPSLLLEGMTLAGG